MGIAERRIWQKRILIVLSFCVLAVYGIYKWSLKEKEPSPNTELTIVRADAEKANYKKDDYKTDDFNNDDYKTDEYKPDTYQTGNYRTENFNTEGSAQTTKMTASSETKTIKFPVYVSGQVVKPDVYYFKLGDIADLAIEKAGGFSEEAAKYYVNLAAVLEPHQNLYIPSNEEIKKGLVPIHNEAFGISASVKSNSLIDNSDIKVNINTATSEELCLIPGVGEKTAESIVRNRTLEGEFVSIEDLMRISGIKEKKFSSMKDYLTVN